MKNVIVTLVIGIIAFEIFEHIIFPLFWFFKNRKKKSVCGPPGLVGRVVEVVQWDKTEGRVFVHGELWSAVSDVPFMKGDKAIIERVEGLTVKVKSVEE